MKQKIVPISEVVKSVFAKLEGQKGLVKEEVEMAWKKLAGEEGFKHSRPVSLRKKVLGVYVDSSAWLEDLVMRKRFFLKGLKRMLGKDRIGEIRFKIGEF